MLMEVKNNFKFFVTSLKCNLKSCMEYKKSFLLQTIFMIINDGFFLIFWGVVFNINGGEINNLTMKEVLFLWAIPPGSWGLANFLFDGINQLNSYIINGSLDTYLLQPKNLLLSISLSKMDFGACGDLIYGLIVGAVASNSILQYLEVIFFMITGAIIMISTFIITRTLAIWIGNVDQIAQVYSQNLLLTLSTYPYQIFGKITRILMFTIVPSYYIVHLPIEILKVFSLKSMIIVIMFSSALFAFSIIFFYQAIKKYESGNNIAMKD